MITTLLFQTLALDVLRVDRDDLWVESDTRVEVVRDAIADLADDGVLHITHDGVTVDFAGARLHGAEAGLTPDDFRGVGILIEAENVTLRNARVSGYRVGILARGAHGLVLEDCDVSGNFRQRLRSTPDAEDAGDWLWPHANDAHEWRENYGAGICLEDSRDVTLRRCRAREGQNGVILDRVTGSRLYDNDFSFLSGWGLALWRSSDNLISRNALDFCVRGYSHGVYNRGQDSAGLLMFEQCSRNLVLENSITHGGDGVFGFAGKEALGDVPGPEGFEHLRRGCNDNLFADNDLSYAVAHGLEMTFSFGNRVLGNRFVENAICGIWGGYSQGMLVGGNEFVANGQAGYGHERGGVNIEHARDDRVLGNRFEANACGVHLWWDEDEALLATPWAVANGAECRGNRIARNEFVGDELALHLDRCDDTRLLANRFEGVGRRLEGEAVEDELLDVDPERVHPASEWLRREAEPLGETRPVGARAHLRGRERILVDEWGPYDWARPRLWFVGRRGTADLWRWLGDEPLEELRVEGAVSLAGDAAAEGVRVSPKESEALQPYVLVARYASGEQRRAGCLSSLRWSVRVFPWTVDPRADADAWRAEANAGASFELGELDLVYGMAGPSQLSHLPAETRAAQLPPDRFGTLAEADVSLPAGRWRVRVTSDDGVRVRLDGEVLLEDWTHHAPRTASAEFEIHEARRARFEVEHFELDGYATLALRVEPAE